MKDYPEIDQGLVKQMMSTEALGYNLRFVTKVKILNFLNCAKYLGGLVFCAHF